MNEFSKSLATVLSENDKLILEEELTKLFAFQDRPATKAKIELFAKELALSGYPLSDILQGINNLKNEDLKAIKLHTIIDAISEKFGPEEKPRIDCKFCFGMGVFLMRDENKYQFALACTCKAGDDYARRMKAARWDGTEVQMVNKRILLAVRPLSEYL